MYEVLSSGIWVGIAGNEIVLKGDEGIVEVWSWSSLFKRELVAVVRLSPGDYIRKKS